MKHELLRKQMRTAMFTALTCVATLVIQVPTPATSGYVNVGDCFVLASGWFLGPWYGLFAGGVGSALADLIGGYPHYIPATFVIKGLMAMLGALIAKRFAESRHKRLGKLLGGLTAELIMVAGYFFYGWAILGQAVTSAVTSVPSNLLQGAVGIVGGILITEAIDRITSAKIKYANRKKQG